jgi:endonuclease YncB( thermonuclease family)
MKERTSLLTSTVFVVLLPVSAEEFRGRVVRILDGDTIEVLRNRQPVRIRLAEVDCPERGQAFGTRARQFTGSLAFGREVTVKARGADGYGRRLAEVLLSDGRSLNRELVSAGLAWHYKRYSANRELAALEAAARAGRRGLWADPHPVPPWEFRRGRRPAPVGNRLRAVHAREVEGSTNARRVDVPADARSVLK